MRILVGTAEIVGQIGILADAFRQLGHQVTTVVQSGHRFYPGADYDVDFSSHTIKWPESVARSTSPPVRAARYMADRSARWLKASKLIATHDLFFFQYRSLFSYSREYPLLHGLGKKIISCFLGDDARHASAYDQQYGPYIHPSSKIKRLEESEEPLAGPLRRLRVAELYSSLVLSLPNQAGLALRPYMNVRLPLELSKYKWAVPGREVPVVVHAPSSKSWKGTGQLMPVLERLAADGVAFDLRLLHNVPNREVVSELTNADVVVDQIHGVSHGKLSLEALASGCAVATGNREDFEPFPPNRPLWHIDPTNAYERLKRLFTDRGLRIRLAHEGIEHVRRYHDHLGVAQHILENLGPDAARRCEIYPTFFARHYRVPDGEKIPPSLRKMTARVIRRWGLPEDVDIRDMAARGLIDADAVGPLKTIPRWKSPEPAGLGGGAMAIAHGGAGLET